MYLTNILTLYRSIQLLYIANKEYNFTSYKKIDNIIFWLPHAELISRVILHKLTSNLIMSYSINKLKKLLITTSITNQSY